MISSRNLPKHRSHINWTNMSSRKHNHKFLTWPIISAAQFNIKIILNLKPVILKKGNSETVLLVPKLIKTERKDHFKSSWSLKKITLRNPNAKLNTWDLKNWRQSYPRWKVPKYLALSVQWVPRQRLISCTKTPKRTYKNERKRGKRYIVQWVLFHQSWCQSKPIRTEVTIHSMLML